MGGVIVKREIYDTFMQASGNGIDFFHGYTYSGHPLASAAAGGPLDPYAEEGLLTRAQTLAAEFENGVHAFKGLPHVIDCRNLGLIGAIEFAPRAGAPGARAKGGFEECCARGVVGRRRRH